MAQTQRSGRDISIFLIVWGVTMVYFLLKTYGDMLAFSETLAFLAMVVISLLATLHTTSDEPYYHNLNITALAWTALFALGMIAVSSVFAGLFQSVLYIPTLYLRTLSTVGSSSITSSTSIATSFLGDMVYQFAAVATGEEILKFAGYTEIWKRYGSRVLAIAIAVGFWAGFHAIQAYPNILYIIPAFICGLLLIGLLELTKSFIPCAIAHATYNTSCILSEYRAQLPTMPTTMPWFPRTLASDDLLLMGLAAMWVGFIFLPSLLRRK